MDKEMGRVDPFSGKPVADHAAAPIAADRVEHGGPGAQARQGDDRRSHRPTALQRQIIGALDLLARREVIHQGEDIEGRHTEAEDVVCRRECPNRLGAPSSATGLPRPGPSGGGCL